MRSVVYFLPPRTSVTGSVGISTRPIFPSRPNAWMRDSSDSFTFRSNPEYVWMMYHFILGLVGCSASGVSPAGASIGAAVAAAAGIGCSVISLLCSCSMMFVCRRSLVTEILEDLVDPFADCRVDDPEINPEQRH